MSHWKNATIHLGEIKAGKPVKLTFYALSSIPKIKEVKPYCGCTAGKYDEEKKELNISYSNAAIPPQVAGKQSVNKRIDIKYEDGTTDVLTIKATKIK